MTPKLKIGSMKKFVGCVYVWEIAFVFIFVKAVQNVAKVLVIAVQIVVIILECVVLNAVEMMKRV